MILYMKIKSLYCNHDWNIVRSGITDFNMKTGDSKIWFKEQCSKCGKTEIKYRDEDTISY